MARDQVPKSVKREVRKLIKALESEKIRVERVILFGSYAKGEQRRYSDIDVAIVSPDFTGIRFEDNRRLLKVKLLLNSRIETHPYTPEDFADSPFVRDEILEYGIEIV
ncbi:MAG: nucleotidyltransferase domain-containing protein [Calditrichaeota bacterium]|nr:MAG: nucleotidyltransferase domain-containing protein [Calditrichota bacterium]